MNPHRGKLILVLGILACCGAVMLTGVPAWVLANHDLRLMDEGRMDTQGRGLTLAGKVCGIIGTALTGAALLTALLLAAAEGP